jgi:Domain of unknown function (DUF1707)
MRASDRDRDRTADLLREHHAVGRLEPEEFAERLDKVFTAKTIGELDDLTADLPVIDLYPLPTATLPKTRQVNSDLPAASVLSQAAGAVQRLPGAWPIAWGTWAIVTAICGLLWLVSGNAWPLVWAAGCGVIIAASQAARSARRHSRPNRRLGLPQQPGTPPDDI